MQEEVFEQSIKQEPFEHVKTEFRHAEVPHVVLQLSHNVYELS